MIRLALKPAFYIILTLFAICLPFSFSIAQAPQYASLSDLRNGLTTGWNTYNTRSVLSHSHLPDGFTLNLGFKQVAKSTEKMLREALIGRRTPDAEFIRPLGHAYDGSFTELIIEWQNLKAKVTTATIGNDWVCLITPFDRTLLPVRLIVEPGVLFGLNPAQFGIVDGHLEATVGTNTYKVFCTAPNVADVNTYATLPTITADLTADVGISTGTERTIDEIKKIIDEKRKAYEAYFEQKYGPWYEVASVNQRAMAWNIIYEPNKKRLLPTVNRIWNTDRGGYAAFCWDNFFGSMLIAADNKWLGFAALLEILDEATPDGFVPNISQGNGRKSWDRSQPLVGSMMALAIYKQHEDKWILEKSFDQLYKWNRWWLKNRLYNQLLCWGSNPSQNPFYDENIHSLPAAMLETGIDDSPMYEGVAFNTDKNIMMMHDVGLNALYIADCKALAEIANILKRPEAKLLTKTANDLSKKLSALYSEPFGLFLNADLTKNEPSKRLSPTLFYPLLAGAASAKQAKTMMEKHYFNADEFFGDFMLPSIARNDPEFNKQKYWKGAVWAPLNYLVYIGLRNYPECKSAAEDLAKKSVNMYLSEYKRMGYVSENYSAITGTGDDPRLNSEKFYFWGALLGSIGLIDNGYIEAPFK